MNKSARKAGLLMLARRAYSSDTVYNRLLEKGYEEEETEEAVEWLTELGYIDDVRYAENAARRLMGRGYNEYKIVGWLMARGIDRGLAKEVIGSLEEEE